MKRRTFFIGLGTAALVSGAAQASTFADDVVAQLSQQGFSDIAIETTWLGRERITAMRDGGTREIILNPRTGEILRDAWAPADGGNVVKPIIDDVADSSGNSGSHSGRGGNSDDGGSDNSGSGSGSSGSGSSGGSSGSDDSGGGDSGSGGSGGGSGSGGGNDDSGKDDKGGKDDRGGKGK